MKRLFPVLLLLALPYSLYSAVYTVQKNDTLLDIAYKTHSDYRHISRINDLNMDRIREGQRLYIPEKIEEYTIQNGDTLIGIADKMRSKVAHIILFNNLANETLYIGQKLLVPVVEETEWSESTDKTPANSSREMIIHEVSPGESLSHLAVRYGVNLEDIIRWNKKQTDRIFIGEKLKLFPSPGFPAADNKSPETAPPTETIIHKVEAGENLPSIAEKYGVSLFDIIRWNQRENYLVYIGEDLKISVPVSELPKNKAPEVTEQVVPIENKTSNTTEKPAEEKKQWTEYEIRSGDTLTAIAQQYGVTVDQLKEWNHLRDDNILIGTKLKIDSPRPAPSPSPAKDPVPQEKENKRVSLDAGKICKAHKVKKGENLTRIAEKYGVSVEDIRRWNNKKSDQLYVNERLKIYVEAPVKTIVENNKDDSSRRPPKVNKINWDVSLTFPVSQGNLDYVSESRRGVLLTLSSGCPVKSPFDAVVEYAGKMNGYNNVIVLKIDKKHRMILGYLTDIYVKEKDQVRKGQSLGKVDYLTFYDKIQLYLEVREGTKNISVFSVFPFLSNEKYWVKK